MYDIKLQLGCFLIALLPAIRYARLSRDLKIEKSKLFLELQIIALVDLFFDSATAYTVNHPDLIPAWLNGALHWGFYIMLNSLVICAYRYFVTMLHRTGNNTTNETPKRFFASHKWMLISSIFITATMPWVFYVDGVTTRYSMGLPVYLCFASIGIMLTFSFIELKRVYHNINGYQRATGLTMFCSMIAIAFVQGVFPEMLISSLYPVFVLYSASMNMEDPYMNYLYEQGEKMRKELDRINSLLNQQQQNTATKKESETDTPITFTGATQETLTISPSQFLFAEAEGNYINIFHFNGDGTLHQSQLRQTMKNIEAMLADNTNLMRVHRAYITNLNHVIHVEGNSQGYQLTLNGTGRKIPVSRSYIAVFNAAFADG